MDKTAEAMFEADCRVDQLVYLPGALVAEDSFPDAFAEDFCEWLPDTPDHPLYAALPRLARFAAGSEADDDDYPEPWVVAEALRGTPGFLVQASTPTRNYDTDGQSFYSGWGSCYLCWLYAATEADILRVCVEWAETRHAVDLAIAKAKASSHQVGG